MLKEIYDRLPKLKVSALLAALSGIVAAEIALTCFIPTWRESFYNILQLKQEDLFITSLIQFFVLMTGLGFAQGIKVWVGQLVSFQVRQAATKLLFKKWVKGSRSAKNYTQAMTESLRNSTELYLEIVIEIIISLSIVIFLMWINRHSPTILAAAVIYTVLASAIAYLFNKPLISQDMNWQSAEGAFREAISNIANGNEDFTSKEKFSNLIFHYYMYVKVVMFFTLFSRVKASIASIVPYALLATQYFAGILTLGDFMSGVATFELIVVNSTILILLYPKLTKAKASYKISQQFYDEVKA